MFRIITKIQDVKITEVGGSFSPSKNDHLVWQQRGGVPLIKHTFYYVVKTAEEEYKRVLNDMTINIWLVLDFSCIYCGWWLWNWMKRQSNTTYPNLGRGRSPSTIGWYHRPCSGLKMYNALLQTLPSGHRLGCTPPNTYSSFLKNVALWYANDGIFPFAYPNPKHHTYTSATPKHTQII